MITSEGRPGEIGQVCSSYRSLFIAMLICILNLLSFVLIHLMVHNDFRTLVLFYILSGPFFAIIEVASVAILIMTICDHGIMRSVTSLNTSIGIKYVKQYLCYPKAMSNILIAVIVMICVLLSRYAASSVSSKNSIQLTSMHGNEPLPTSHVQNISLQNASKYNHLPFKPPFQYNNNALATRISNNSGIYNLFVSNAAVRKRDASKQDISNGYVLMNGTRTDNRRDNIVASNLLESRQNQRNKSVSSTNETRQKHTVIPFHNITSHGRNELIKQRSMDEANNRSKHDSEGIKNKDLRFARKLNFSSSFENITWHHVLPIWKKVIHKMLATNIKRSNENGNENHRTTQNVIRTWKSTLLGMLAIILFASFFVQLSLLITTFTTLKVLKNQSWLPFNGLQCSCRHEYIS